MYFKLYRFKAYACSFILVPVMLVFAYFLNKRMKTAFKRNRIRIGR